MGLVLKKLNRVLNIVFWNLMVWDFEINKRELIKNRWDMKMSFEIKLRLVKIM